MDARGDLNLSESVELACVLMKALEFIIVADQEYSRMMNATSFGHSFITASGHPTLAAIIERGRWHSDSPSIEGYFEEELQP